MVDAAALLMAAELTVAGAAALPFVIHRFRMRRWLQMESLEPAGDGGEQRLTMVLPVWNEEKLIISKLEDLAAQDFPVHRMELIIIDSASTDKTLELVDGWLQENADVFPRNKVIRMPSRLGKTEAVRRAFLAADDDSTVIAMSDCDARLEPGSLRRMVSWFDDVTIGAVGGTPIRSGAEGEAHGKLETTYRSLFTQQRVAESMADSTPFLEGSICGFRSAVIQPEMLDTHCNADDAQLATMARLNGGRSIQDIQLRFREGTPPTAAGRRSRKVRRAQGLCRHLWRNRRNWFSRQQGRFGSILGWQAVMHLFVPWLVLMAICLGFSRWAVGTGDASFLEDISLVLFIIELLVLSALLGVMFDIRIPGLGFLQTFLDAMWNLFCAHVFVLRGRSLHIWEQPERG